MSEEERTPQQWAQELGAELHGMTDERWDAYLRYLEDEDKDKLVEVFKRLAEEAKALRAGFHADKRVSPENQEQRRRLSRSLRELRTRRLNDIQARYGPLKDDKDEFEDIIDDPNQHPIRSYSEEEADVKDAPEYRSAAEAYEDYMKRREEKESNDD